MVRTYNKDLKETQALLHKGNMERAQLRLENHLLNILQEVHEKKITRQADLKLFKAYLKVLQGESIHFEIE